jgi:hypothetical protein
MERLLYFYLEEDEQTEDTKKGLVQSDIPELED